MPIVSIGDMSQHFLSLRNGGAIKSDLARLGQELATGQNTDLAATLGGDTRQLSGINHSLAVANAFQTAAQDASLTLKHMQLGLNRIDVSRGNAVNSLLAISSQSQSSQMKEAALTARGGFDDIVSALNGKIAGRSLFSGAATGSAAVAPAKEMFDAIKVAVSGAATVADLKQGIEQWFNDPAGGFATMGYLGDGDAPIQRQISETTEITLSAKANDKAVVALLQATATAALAVDPDFGLSQIDQAKLQNDAGLALLTGASDLTELQTGLGVAQNAVDQTQTRLASEATALGMVQNDLMRADPFETATRLQALQVQLETHFTVTSRLSRLSLAEYI